MYSSVAFLSCSSLKDKRTGFLPVRLRYRSPLFVKSLVYAEDNYKVVFVLSAKYGLLLPDDQIEYYDLFISELSSEQKKKWSSKVQNQMEEYGVVPPVDLFVGKKYISLLPSYIGRNVLEGLSIGLRLKWFNERLSPKGKLGLL